MDSKSEYDNKLLEMQKYLPFLDELLSYLEENRTGSTTRPIGVKYDKIMSLRSFLVTDKRMKMENLIKCEGVIIKLQQKVDLAPTKESPLQDAAPSKNNNSAVIENEIIKVDEMANPSQLIKNIEKLPKVDEKPPKLINMNFYKELSELKPKSNNEDVTNSSDNVSKINSLQMCRAKLKEVVSMCTKTNEKIEPLKIEPNKYQEAIKLITRVFHSDKKEVADIVENKQKIISDSNKESSGVPRNIFKNTVNSDIKGDRSGNEDTSKKQQEIKPPPSKRNYTRVLRSPDRTAHASDIANDYSKNNLRHIRDMKEKKRRKSKRSRNREFNDPKNHKTDSKKQSNSMHNRKNMDMDIKNSYNLDALNTMRQNIVKELKICDTPMKHDSDLDDMSDSKSDLEDKLKIKKSFDKKDKEEGEIGESEEEEDEKVKLLYNISDVGSENSKSDTLDKGGPFNNPDKSLKSNSGNKDKKITLESSSTTESNKSFIDPQISENQYIGIPVDNKVVKTTDIKLSLLPRTQTRGTNPDPTKNVDNNCVSNIITASSKKNNHDSEKITKKIDFSDVQKLNVESTSKTMKNNLDTTNNSDKILDIKPKVSPLNPKIESPSPVNSQSDIHSFKTDNIKSSFEMDVLKALNNEFSDVKLETNFLSNISSEKYHENKKTDLSVPLCSSTLGGKSRRISLETYKEKQILTSAPKVLSENQRKKEFDKNYEHVSRVLTAKEMERFGSIINSTVEDTIAHSEKVKQDAFDLDIEENIDMIFAHEGSRNSVEPASPDSNSSFKFENLPSPLPLKIEYDDESFSHSKCDSETGSKRDDLANTVKSTPTKTTEVIRSQANVYSGNSFPCNTPTRNIPDFLENVDINTFLSAFTNKEDNNKYKIETTGMKDSSNSTPTYQNTGQPIFGNFHVNNTRSPGIPGLDVNLLATSNFAYGLTNMSNPGHLAFQQAYAQQQQVIHAQRRMSLQGESIPCSPFYGDTNISRSIQGDGILGQPFPQGYNRVPMPFQTPNLQQSFNSEMSMGRTCPQDNRERNLYSLEQTQRQSFQAEFNSRNPLNAESTRQQIAPREFIRGRSMHREPSQGRSLQREPSVGQYLYQGQKYQQEQNHCGSFQQDPTYARPFEQEHSQGHFLQQDRSQGRSFQSEHIQGRPFQREQSQGRSSQREQSQGRPFQREQSQGRSSQREQSQGRSFQREKSQGRSFQHEQSQGRLFQREKSQERSFKRENSKGRSFPIENSDGRSFKREQNRGGSFQREKSQGRSFKREQSQGRSFQNEPNQERSFDREKSQGRSLQPDRSGDTSVRHDPRIQREHSQGRSLQRDQSQSFKRESSQGRSLQREPSQGQPSQRELYHRRPFHREPSRGRSLHREPSQEKSLQSEPSQGRSFHRGPSQGILFHQESSQEKLLQSNKSNIGFRSCSSERQSQRHEGLDRHSQYSKSYKNDWKSGHSEHISKISEGLTDHVSGQGDRYASSPSLSLVSDDSVESIRNSSNHNSPLLNTKTLKDPRLFRCKDNDRSEEKYDANKGSRQYDDDSFDQKDKYEKYGSKYKEKKSHRRESSQSGRDISRGSRWDSVERSRNRPSDNKTLKGYPLTNTKKMFSFKIPKIKRDQIESSEESNDTVVTNSSQVTVEDEDVKLKDNFIEEASRVTNNRVADVDLRVLPSNDNSTEELIVKENCNLGDTDLRIHSNVMHKNTNELINSKGDVDFRVPIGGIDIAGVKSDEILLFTKKDIDLRLTNEITKQNDNIFFTNDSKQTVSELSNVVVDSEPRELTREYQNTNVGSSCTQLINNITLTSVNLNLNITEGNLINKIAPVNHEYCNLDTPIKTGDKSEATAALESESSDTQSKTNVEVVFNDILSDVAGKIKEYDTESYFERFTENDPENMCVLNLMPEELNQPLNSNPIVQKDDSMQDNQPKALECSPNDLSKESSALNREENIEKNVSVVNTANKDKSSEEDDKKTDESKDAFRVATLLNDKRKILQMISLLGNNCSEKIRRKLEKLVEIESDEEDSDPKESTSEANCDFQKCDKGDQTAISENVIIDKSLPPETVIIPQNIEISESLDTNIGEPKCIAEKNEPPKEKKRILKGNRELLSLQEDVRNMFISQGVLEANGLRLCRQAAKNVDNSTPNERKSAKSSNTSSVLKSPETDDVTKTNKKKVPVKKAVIKKNKKKTLDDSGETPMDRIDVGKLPDEDNTTCDDLALQVYEYNDSIDDTDLFQPNKPGPRSKKIKWEQKNNKINSKVCYKTVTKDCFVELATNISDKKHVSKEDITTPKSSESPEDGKSVSLSHDSTLNVIKLSKKMQKINKNKIKTVGRKKKKAAWSAGIINKKKYRNKTSISHSSDSEMTSKNNLLEHDSDISLNISNSEASIKKDSIISKSKNAVANNSNNKTEEDLTKNNEIMKNDDLDMPSNDEKIPECTLQSSVNDIQSNDLTTDNIETCFISEASSYNCSICNKFEGFDIVAHYKSCHPHSEVLISRLEPNKAKIVIEQSLQNQPKVVNIKKRRKLKCRFCDMIYPFSSLDNMFSHIIHSHTGEYAHKCTECSKDASDVCTSLCNKSSRLPPPFDVSSQVIIGYICSICNYTQVSLENLNYHVSLKHAGVLNCKTHKIILSPCAYAPRGKQKNRISPTPLEPSITAIEPTRSLRSKTKESEDIAISKEAVEVDMNTTMENDSVDKIKSKRKNNASLVEETTPAKKARSNTLDVESFTMGENEKESVSESVFTMASKSSSLSIETSAFTMNSGAGAMEMLDIKDENFVFDSYIPKETQEHSYDNVVVKNEPLDPHGEETIKISPHVVDISIMKTEPAATSDVIEQLLDDSGGLVTVGNLQSKKMLDGNTKYTCLFEKCGYTTRLLLLFSPHVEFYHSEEFWDGYCGKCEKKVSETSRPTGHALEHLLSHMNDDEQNINESIEQPTAAIVSAPQPKIQVRPELQLLSTSENVIEESSSPPAGLGVENLMIANVFSLNESQKSVPKLNPTSTEIDAETTPKQKQVIIRYTPVKSSNSEKVIISKITPGNSILKGIAFCDRPKPPATLQVARLNKQPRNYGSSPLSVKRAAIDSPFKCANENCTFKTHRMDMFIEHVESRVCEDREGQLLGEDATTVANHIANEHAEYMPVESREEVSPGKSLKNEEFVTSSPLETQAARASLPAPPIMVPAPPIMVPAPPIMVPAPPIMVPAPEALTSCVERYKCTADGGTCGASFFTPECFLKHAAVHQQVLSCQVCGPAFTRRPKQLLQHLRTQHSYRLYTCVYCGQAQDTEVEIERHLNLKHPYKRPLTFLRHNIEQTGTEIDEDKVVLLDLETKDGDLDLKNNISQKALPTKSILKPVTPLNRRANMSKVIRIPPPPLIPSFSESYSTQSHNSSAGNEYKTNLNEAVQQDIILLDNASLITTTVEKCRGSDVSVSDKCRFPMDMVNLKQTPLLSPANAVIDADCNLSGNKETVPEENTVISLDSDDDDTPLAFANKSKIYDDSSTSDAALLEEAQRPDANIQQTILSNHKNELICDLATISKDDLLIMQSMGFSGKDLFKCGNDDCNYSSFTSSGFKDHLTVCEKQRSRQLPCFHCKKLFKQCISLIEHIKLHGIPRFQCSRCNLCLPAATALNKHSRKEHNSTAVSITPVDPFKINSDTDFFIGDVEEPIKTRKMEGKRKRIVNKPLAKSVPISVTTWSEKQNKSNTFGPDEIDSLPLKPILTESIYCRVCSFESKVKSNMQRHLQMHLNEIVVPSATPVNPVPHLKTNEMHFDKMTNLALSSNIDRPAVTKGPEKKSADEGKTLNAENFPKFVPENERFVCGSKACQYISLDEMLFRHHWEALHDGEKAFFCCHCGCNVAPGGSAISTGVIAAHMRLHEAKLFVCDGCDFLHPKAREVERHALEAHGGGAPRQVRPATATKPPAMELRPWACGHCSTRTTFKSDIVEHAKIAHGFRYQFKCGLCQHFYNTRTLVDNHFSSKHFGRPVNVITNYSKSDGSDEPVLDNQPIWWKQRRRGSQFVGETLPAQNCDEEVTPPAAKKTKMTPNLSKQQQIAKEKIDIACKNAATKTTFAGGSDPPPSTSAPPTGGKKAGGRILCDYGMPENNMYVCPFCKKFSTNLQASMEIHLHEEIKYRRYACEVCGYKSFDIKRIKDHSMEAHRLSKVTVLPPDPQIEGWVENCLKHQDDIMSRSVQTDPEPMDISHTPIQEIADSPIQEIADSPMQEISEPLIQKIIQDDLLKNKSMNSSLNAIAFTIGSPLRGNTASDDILSIEDDCEDGKLIICEDLPQLDTSPVSIDKSPKSKHSGVIQGRTFRCGYCSYVCLRKWSVQQHLGRHHQGQPSQIIEIRDSSEKAPAVWKSPGKKKSIDNVQHKRKSGSIVKTENVQVKIKSGPISRTDNVPNKIKSGPISRTDNVPNKKSGPVSRTENVQNKVKSGPIATTENVQHKTKYGPFAKTHMCLVCEMSMDNEEIADHKKICFSKSKVDQVLIKRTVVYKCSSCMQLCPNMASLNNHSDELHPGKELNYVMHKLGNPKSKKRLVQDPAAATAVRPRFSCRYCVMKFINFSALYDHHTKDHEERIMGIHPLYIEPIADTGELDLDVLIDSPFMCIIRGCKFVEYKLNDLLSHMRYHYVSYKCCECSENFETYNDYYSHVLRHGPSFVKTKQYTLDNVIMQDRLQQLINKITPSIPLLRDLSQQTFLHTDKNEVLPLVNKHTQEAKQESLLVERYPRITTPTHDNNDSSDVVYCIEIIDSPKMADSPKHSNVSRPFRVRQVARKSTTFVSEKPTEYSYYGTKPTIPKGVTTTMPILGAERKISVMQLNDIVKIFPRVVVNDICYIT